jgi:hypothetical protein
MTTYAQFDAAIDRLVPNAASMRAARISRPQFCRMVAELVFTGEIHQHDQAFDVEIVRDAAKSLWRGDGTLGLV